MNRALLDSEASLALERVRLPDQEWDAFAENHPHHLFQKSVWGLCLERGYQNQVSYYVLRRGGQIVLGLPGMVLDFKLFKIYYAGTPYGGFVGDFSLIPEFIERLSAALKKENVDLLRITQNHDQDYPALAGFRTLRGYQHAIHFSRDERHPSEQFHKNAVRNVRRAEREEVTLRMISGPEDITAYHKMYVLAMKRLRVTRPHTRRLYEAVYENLISHKQGTLLLAEHQKKTAAGILLLYDRGTVYFFGSAFHPDTQFLRPNDFLMARAIEYAREQGFSVFDFMTTGESQIGLVQYKEKWGAISQPFLVHEKILNPLKGRAWNFLWRMVNTPAGSSLIDAFRKE